MPRSHTHYIVPPAILAASLWALNACTGPFPERSQEELRSSLIRDPAIEGPAEPLSTETLADDGEIANPFTEEQQERLRDLGGPGAYRRLDPSLGRNLLNESVETRTLSLGEAITTAVRNNLPTRSARLLPAIGEKDLRVAEAFFDWVFLSDFTWESTDQPSRVPTVNGVPVGVGADEAQNVEFSYGVEKPTTIGGRFSATHRLTYRDDETQGVSTDPDPSNAAEFQFGYEQPLLEGFGRRVNLAEVHLAQNTARDAAMQYKRRLITTVTDAENAYWELVLARDELQIRQRLLDMGIDVRDTLEPRLEFDAILAEYADAVATVERRRGNVIRARNRLKQASDRLKQIINHPDLPVEGETLILPSTEPTDGPVGLSLADALTRAIRRRPEVERSILAIDNADIRVMLAENAKLPQLDLQVRTTLRGLDSGVGGAHDEAFDRDFVDYLVGLTFEQAIRNRAAIAEEEARRIEQMQSIVEYRRTLQDVALDVKLAMRDVATSYALIEQSRISRQAATESLRTLREREEIEGLTPEFLDLKFGRQEELAQAEFDEISAIIDYANGLAALRDATGTALEENGIDFKVPDADDVLEEGVPRDER